MFVLLQQAFYCSALPLFFSNKFNWESFYDGISIKQPLSELVFTDPVKSMTLLLIDKPVVLIAKCAFKLLRNSVTNMPYLVF